MQSNNMLMPSPSNKPLTLLLTKTKEGIERRGVTTYESTVSFLELAEHFVIEDSAEIMKEEQKRQRDVEKSRVNGIKKYWSQSQGAVFPGMIMFASTIDVIETHVVAGKTLVEAVLPASACRFIADGQGRTAFIKDLLSTDEGAQFASFTISFKLVVTNTDSLIEPHASDVIRQLFSDLHCHVKKPSKSVSKLFDNSTPFARLQSEVLDLDMGSMKLKTRIALHGKLRRGNIWTYDQLCSMLTKFLGQAPSQLNKDLADETVYSATIKLCKDFFARVGEILPLHLLNVDNFLEVHENSMFTKAIFATGLGYVGRSIVDEMMIDESMTWESALKTMHSLESPMLSKADKFWQTAKVCMVDEGKIKIIKGTDKRIGSIICRELRIYPCKDLGA